MHHFFTKRLPTLIKIFEDNARPTEEDYANVGKEILQTFGIPTLKLNGKFTELTLEQRENLKFVTLIRKQQYNTEEKNVTVDEWIKTQFKEITGKDFDGSKHIVVSIPNNLYGGGDYSVYEV